MAGSILLYLVRSPFARKLLLTEALRGEGAHIVDEDGIDI